MRIGSPGPRSDPGSQSTRLSGLTSDPALALRVPLSRNLSRSARLCRAVPTRFVTSPPRKWQLRLSPLLLHPSILGVPRRDRTHPCLARSGGNGLDVLHVVEDSSSVQPFVG